MRRLGIVALTFLVAGSVFFESWSAAAHAAEAGGRPHPSVWPTSLEAFIAILVLVYWEARSQGRRAPGARALLLLTTAVASLIQALDAPRTALGVTTAVWTPIALLLSVEFATWLLYGRTAEPAGSAAVSGVPPPEAGPAPDAALSQAAERPASLPAPDRPAARPGARHAAGSGLTVAERRRVARRAGQMPATRIAAETGVPVAKVRAYVAARDARTGPPSGNGDGPQGGTR